MKKIVLCFIVLCCGFGIKAQEEVSVEKSIWGVQIGFLGTHVYNEARLTNSIALRTEMGLDINAWYSSLDIYTSKDYLMVPTLSLEPRYYYNLKKRDAKSKRIDNNSGNFFALKINYHHPNVFISSDKSITGTYGDISFAPMWGLRRHFGKSNFNYEVGGGIVYYRYFSKFDNYGDLDPFIYLRIGYTF